MMNKLFLYALISFLFFNCSSENTNQTESEPKQNTESVKEKTAEPIAIQAVDPNQYGKIDKMNFASGKENLVSTKTQVIGISINNQAKAYPIYLLAYHHHLEDVIDGQPIWVTYCLRCRSARIFDPIVQGEELDFEIVGAFSGNSVFRDTKTNSTWLQETGESIQGHYQNTSLNELFSEQVSLKDWLIKYPESEVLQYDPAYVKWYQVAEKNYRLPKDISFQAREETSLVIGLEVGDLAKAYDWEVLKQEKVILDKVGNHELLLTTSPDFSSFFVYNRTLNDQVLNFQLANEGLIDTNTQSKWNYLGQCLSGPLKGASLTPIQAYQEIWKYWQVFHPNTTRY
jgi:hypothetical protein